MSMGEEQGHLWYHGWNIVGACVLSQFAVAGMAVSAFSLFLPDWSTQLHTPVSTLQLGFAAFGLVTALISPMAGVFADRYPTRMLFGTGLFIMALVCLAMSFVTANWQFLALYAVPVSVVVSLASLIPANAVVSRWFVRRVGLALGVTALGQGLPGVILPPVIAALLPFVGWRMIWRFGGIVIALIILPVVVGVLRDRPTPADGLSYVSGGSGAQMAHHSAREGLTWHGVVRRRSFWLLVVVFLSLLIGYITMASGLGPIAVSRGFTRETIGGLLSVFNIAQITATLLAGYLSDRFGNRFPLAGLGLASAIGIALIAAGTHLTVFGLGVALVGISGGFWPLLAAACAVEFGADGAGRAFGLVSAFLPLIVLTPFVVAKTQESLGTYIPSLSVVALLAFAGSMVSLVWMHERRPALPFATS